MTPLDQALERAHADEGKRMDYYRLFLRSDLFVSIDGEATSEKVSLRIALHEGKRILPAFDSLEKLQAWAKAAGRYVVIPAHALIAGLASDVHVWLNSGTEHGKEFVPEELEWLRGQVAAADPARMNVEKNTEVMVGSPAKIPDGIVDRLIEVLSRAKEVQAAHLGQIFISGKDQAPHLALVVKMEKVPETAMESVFRDVGVAVQGLLQDQPLDLILYGGGSVDQAIVDATEPFYVRS